MQPSYTLFLFTLPGGGAYAAAEAASKLNQYASISDCQNDVNIISHASPAEGSCHAVDPRTGSLFLVTGQGAAGAEYDGFSGTGCDGNNLVVLRIQEGTCTARPAAVGGIWFGLSAAV